MFEDIKKVHLIGAGGIGVSAVGKLFLHLGKTVTGSDGYPNEQVEMLQKAGATISIGQMADNVTEDVDLIVYSPAVPETNVERVRARELGLIEMSYPELLGEIAKQKRTIAVSGTHGKSTTTAMIGLILEAAGLDPLVIVGSKVPSWTDGNLRMGHGDFFVVEACEHMASFLNISPEFAVVTNIEMDHPDFYRDLAHVKETFAKWTAQAKEVIAFGADDPHLEGLKLMIPGAFNLMNAHAAAAAAKRVGVSDEVIVKALNAFPGLWRRFEKIGVWHDAEIISDYAHHPTAIAATLKAAREAYPNRRIVLCFQPHQHARTKELFDEFVPSFDGADKIILVEIYAVAGRLEEEGEISSKDLVREVAKRGKDVHYAADLDDAERQLRDAIKPEDVVIVMGAGDIDNVARRFI